MPKIKKRRVLTPEVTPDTEALRLTLQYEQFQALRDDTHNALRDRIAEAALIGILTHGTHHTPEMVMKQAYEYADAGMKVRDIKTVAPQPVAAVIVVPPAQGAR